MKTYNRTANVKPSVTFLMKFHRTSSNANIKVVNHIIRKSLASSLTNKIRVAEPPVQSYHRSARLWSPYCYNWLVNAHHRDTGIDVTASKSKKIEFYIAVISVAYDPATTTPDTIINDMKDWCNYYTEWSLKCAANQKLAKFNYEVYPVKPSIIAVGKSESKVVKDSRWYGKYSYAISLQSPRYSITNSPQTPTHVNEFLTNEVGKVRCDSITNHVTKIADSVDLYRNYLYTLLSCYDGEIRFANHARPTILKLLYNWFEGDCKSDLQKFKNDPIPNDIITVVTQIMNGSTHGFYRSMSDANRMFGYSYNYHNEMPYMSLYVETQDDLNVILMSIPDYLVSYKHCSDRTDVLIEKSS